MKMRELDSNLMSSIMLYVNDITRAAIHHGFNEAVAVKEQSDYGKNQLRREVNHLIGLLGAFDDFEVGDDPFFKITRKQKQVEENEK